MSEALGPDAPRVAVGAVILERGPTGTRVVLARRGRAPNLGAWSIPGGRVEPGETLAAAVAREALEETGLVVDVGPLVEIVEIIRPPHHYVILDYLCAARGGELRAGDDASEVALAPVGALEPFAVSEAVLRVVDRAVAILASGAAG